MVNRRRRVEFERFPVNPAFLICLLLILPSAVSAKADAKGFEARVPTEQGAVEGFVLKDYGVVGWLGIPYAQPPLGNLRWKSPKDPAARKLLLRAKSHGHPCSQRDPKSSEDCLYLNIWRPHTKEKNLPVFVYIHGGSNIDGSGEGSWYNVARHFNVVVVTINYRLGPMGWFLHPALLTGDPKDDSGDFGTLDQIKALEWVQKNIENFGGDKTNVTLAGASAGAQNVSYLMHSGLAKDLFQKAIIESNYPGIRPVSAAYKSSKQVLYNLLVADKIAADTKAARSHADRMTKQEIRDYLYRKSPAEIANAYSSPDLGPINWGDLFRDDIRRGTDHLPPPLVQNTDNRPEFVYAIGDGYVLPKDYPIADFSKGHVFPRPLIVGTTKNENNTWNSTWPFNFQEGKSLTALVEEAVKETNPNYQHMQKFFDIVGEHDSETFKRNYKFGTELLDELDTYLGSQLPARHLAVNTKKTPVYVYRFDWESDPAKDYKIPFQDAWIFYNGSLHTSESDFFYQTFFGLPTDKTETEYKYTTENLAGRKALSLAIRPYLYEFLHNRAGRIEKNNDQPVEWKPWTAQAEQFIVFDADYAKPDIHMTASGIARTPEQLYALHEANSNQAVRDWIDYYVLWSWQWNWYRESKSGHFETAPGPNSLFDPATP